MGWVVLKRRVIPLELWRNGRLVKTVRFDPGRDVGDPIKSSQVYSDQDADELILLNIGGMKEDLQLFSQTVREIAACCFVPLSVGGGIRSLQDADTLFSAGADKVVVNTAAYHETNIVTEISQKYGTQAIIISIDYRWSDGGPRLFSHGGSKEENITLKKHLENIAGKGAGEIMLQSMERDGSMEGYDLELLQTVAAMVPAPIILAGGAGNFFHLVEAFQSGADGAACGSLFNFGDNNPLRAKAFLKNYKIPLKTI
jgi:imidazole glycerol-phosphate synthase subunit HisF